jgi:capsular polysaccharide transport system ATP-binding protein
MTLELRDVMKRIRIGATRVVYEDLNIRIEQGASVALLGHSEAGVEGLVGLLCGADAPDAGRVIRTHSISWPIPWTAFMHQHMSLAANARFLARLYEVDERDYLARIAQCGMDKVLDVRGDRVSGEVRTAFAFVAGICLPFDCYILTRASIAQKTDPELAPRLIEEVRKRAGLLLVASSVKPAKQYCDQAYVFDKGQATFYDNMDAAAEHFNSIESNEKDRDADSEEGDEDSDLEIMVGLDF